jgi:hypothetical protein
MLMARMSRASDFSRVVLAAALVTPGAVWAQAPPAVEVSAGVERLRYAYRFDNDSSFDTPFLVPHFFEQRYERTGPVWRVDARYRLASYGLRTSVVLAPNRSAFGSDFDTFFQPDGDIVTSGTAGDVRLSGLGLEQAAWLVSDRAITLSAVVAWRRDRADFLPADRVVTRTQPPSETRTWTTDRETTVSQTVEVGIEAAASRQAPGSPWRLEGTVRGVPSVWARLLVQLPDKYPGRDIVFSAPGWSVSTRMTASRTVARSARAGVWLAGGYAGRYRAGLRFSRNTAAAGVVLGFDGSR